LRHWRSSVEAKLGLVLMLVLVLVLVLMLPLKRSVDGDGDLLHPCGLYGTNHYRVSTNLNFRKIGLLETFFQDNDLTS